MNACERFYRQSSRLPAMPEVGRELLHSLDRADTGLLQLAELIEQDATLAAKVLRLANSPHYSPGHQIDRVADAAHALGLETLRNLAVAAAFSGSFPVAAGLEREAFWRHCVATASYARLLDRLLGGDGETAHLAGLLLRCGQLLMALDAPGLVAEVEAHAAEPGSRFSLELHRFGCTHAEVTASLAAHWQFPPRLVEAFRDTLAPLEVRPFLPLAAVLHIAEVLADCAAGHEEPLQALRNAVPELVEHLHLDLELLGARLATMGDPAAEIERLLH